jgi:hypothetical protein
MGILPELILKGLHVLTELYEYVIEVECLEKEGLLVIIS